MSMMSKSAAAMAASLAIGGADSVAARCQRIIDTGIQRMGFSFSPVVQQASRRRWARVPGVYYPGDAGAPAVVAPQNRSTDEEIVAAWRAMPEESRTIPLLELRVRASRERIIGVLRAAGEETPRKRPQITPEMVLAAWAVRPKGDDSVNNFAARMRVNPNRVLRILREAGLRK